MNMNKSILLGSVAAGMFAISTANVHAQVHRSGGFAPRASSSHGMVAPNNVTRGMPPGSRNFDGRRFNDFRFRDHDFDDRFRFRNVFVFNGGFGFPFWGWGGPWGWGYPYGYPYYGYPYYGGGYAAPGYSGYDSGGGYGYDGQGSQSQVAQLQRHLKAAGYYHGSIDGTMGPRTRSALRAYQRERGVANHDRPPPQSY